MNISGDDLMDCEKTSEKKNSGSSDSHSEIYLVESTNPTESPTTVRPEENIENVDGTSGIEVKNIENLLHDEIRQLSVNTGMKATQSTSKMQNLCDDVFAKVGTYLNGEVESTCSDYQLIIDMNRVTTARYTTMLETAKVVGDNLVTINQKLSKLHPYLDQIESIEKSVLSLEQAAYKLDLYSKQLEERFKLACKE